MNAQLVRTAVILGLLSVIGPLAIDMYLPALPAIGVDLGASDAVIQRSLMAYMAAVAVCQLVYGPLSDMFGRKPPLYFGMAVFVVGSVGCALAPNADMLILFRFLQGVGACASMSLPRAIVRDNYTGAEAAQLMSLIMLVFSVSPILAPLSGSLVIAFGDWRAMFWVMTVVGVLGLLLLVFALRETRPREARLDSGLGSALRAYGTLLRDWRFLGLTLIGTFGMSSFMAFLGNSSFVYIDHYGLTPTQYSLAFSVNAVSFFAVSQMTGWLVGRFGLNRVVRVAVAGYTASMLTLFAVVMAGIDSVFVLGGFMFVAFGFLGLVLPSTGVLAMEEQGDIAGSASALMGTVQMIAASVVMGIVGAFGDGTARPMVIAFAACAILAFVITQLTLGARPRSPAEVPAE
ncbi:MAG: multidrug effflux MFS transporter [Devosia sp.]|uniref:multidrug effflux MFS transporter n=1 Tax=unclassified Devosia TaxID=196773 RepID=UPI00092CB537|nr:MULTISPECIES: multidrug effflux MFS transporter [unclassified Devosia]MBL8597714.1 multidrug effflux MFS transporter [Devosia sp.]MBN9345249.1 multidrug effflux MFS transporter [Devosia sp.]OJX50715.1 MAG: Bcr/CflA family drug resistance efflux transporter [Devosia sp. 66-22]